MTWFNNYIGIPYITHGRSREQGFDCYGLIRHVMLEHFQIEMPELTIESAPTERDLKKQLLSLRRNWVKVDKPEEGDLIQFKIANQPTHIAVAIGIDSLFLHTEPRKNACIEDWKSPLWKHLVDSVWRHKTKCLHVS